MKGKLIVLGTPIGNLGDFSPRAVETLKKVDFIIAEDTRVTRKLLNYFNIHKPLISYFKHNETNKTDLIIKKIMSGENCAIVSDAGMPTISDPGEELVKKCAKANIKVEVVPGPCAFVAALAVSGLPSNRFTFEGFLGKNKKAVKTHLEELKDEKRTMIFYESPHRLQKSLCSFLKILGNRKISISREITKIYEEVIRTTLEKAVEIYKNKLVKGEFVIVIAGKKQSKDELLSLEDGIESAKLLLCDGHSINEAAKIVSHKTNLKKSDVYKELLKEFEIEKFTDLF
ncbi:MAG: 16S rRNA (cytidine(1402)-2'-O)-methyltransferase [Oscillospiraceae bacterium]|nr:16S rRNA (cytidine(1402)-2'-O)-methyltransferase [Oscillospiraceae bacterium]